MIIAPIYRDTVYSTTAETLTYSITLDGAVIFNGRAYAAPGENGASINVNRICENYLSNNDIEALLSETETYILAPEAFRTFELRDGDGNLLETFKFLYNYDYEGDFDGEPMEEYPLSHPINNTGHINMRRLWTVFDGTEVHNMINENIYTDEPCGIRYCLYYLNSYGGWDAFAIEGSAQRTDKVSRHQYNKSYNNQSLEYERNSYISEIETSWKLNTGILDDSQGHNLCWNLLSSNRVYLHDLDEDKIYPVVITNTQNVYQTYKDSDKQPIQYEIDVVESQTKLRR